MPMSDYMREIRARLGSRLLEIPSVTVLLFDERDRLLLVRHAEGGHWATPGGGVEPHELPADAAVREMWEETGLHVELVRILGVYGGPEFTTTYRNGDAVSFMVTVFLARRIGGEPAPDGREIRELAAFGREEIRALHMPAWATRIVEECWDDRERERARFDPPRWRPPA